MTDTAGTSKPKKDKKKKDKPADTSAASGSYNLAGPGSSVPADSERFTIADHVGRSLLITPREIGDKTTDYGTSEVMTADIVVLDMDNPADSDEFPGAWIFAKFVIGQLRDPLRDGKRVVGGLIQDQAAKKAGQTAPYKLTAPTDAQYTAAGKYLDSVDPLR